MRSDRELVNQSTFLPPLRRRGGNSYIKLLSTNFSIVEGYILSIRGVLAPCLREYRTV